MATSIKEPFDPFVRLSQLSNFISPDLTKLEKRLMEELDRLNKEVTEALARISALETALEGVGELRAKFEALKAGVAAAADKLDTATPDGVSAGNIPD